MKEHKFVIVRTFANHISDCYGFATKNYSNGNIKLMPEFSSECRVSDEIKIKPYVGGMLAIQLISSQTNGEAMYSIIETVYFDKGIVSGIEIYTEFEESRKQAARNRDRGTGTLGTGVVAVGEGTEGKK